MNLRKKILLGFLSLFWLLGPTSSFAEFNKGYEAYRDRNYTTAQVEFLEAANEGNAKAQGYLGLMNFSGQGMPQNETEAVRWFRLAEEQLRSLAEQGDSKGQYLLGWMYYGGFGIPRNAVEVRRLFDLAAEGGLLEAQIYLALVLTGGNQVWPDNPTEAFRWWRMAAEQGSAEGYKGMASSYEHGWGVEENLVLAYMWYLIAENKGADIAVYQFNLLDFKMSPQQIDEAKLLYQNWVLEHQ